ncbi:MAG: rod shape-determining protein MreC [Longimicrobiales bacterium]
MISTDSATYCRIDYVLDFDGSKRARRKDVIMSIGVLGLALLLLALKPAYQRPIRDAFRTTVLRPFIGAQTRLAIRRARTEDLSVVRAERDSLAALVAADATLSEENRQLRGILAMRDRTGDSFVPAEIVRLGMGGAESTFILNVGSADGVHKGSPVLTPAGLLGVVLEVNEHVATAIDWSHPDFRTSAMTADGGTYGIVEGTRGRFREEDALALRGAPFQTNISPGRRVVTSGRGDLIPRGIFVGTITGIDEADAGYRKSYIVRPAVRPEEARHVLVGKGDTSKTDFSDMWNVSAPADTASLADTMPPVNRPKPKAKTTAKPAGNQP